MWVPFLLRRLGYGIGVLFGVVSLVFLLFHVLPADPARLTLGQRADVASLENVRKELHLDQPLGVQFLYYLNDLAPLSLYSDAGLSKLPSYTPLFKVGSQTWVWKTPYLRRSYQSKKEVWDLLMESIPGTLVLACAAILFAVVVGISLGILAAVKQHTWMDSSALLASVLGISAPSFFTGILIAYFLGFVLHVHTGLPMTGSLFEMDPFEGRQLQLKHVILPAITLGIRPLAIIVQLTRSSLLEVFSQDYIRTAYAKGVPEWRVLFFHALPNALNPVITAITGWFAELLAGAFFVEYIFGWKGVGKVTVDALEKLDFPVLMGSILVTASIFVLVNMASDLLNRWLDPRIRLH
jgi:peptide/nickel transport system permease protein